LNQLKVQALVAAYLTKQGKDLVLEGRVYNVPRGAFVGGTRYFGDVKGLRTMSLVVSSWNSMAASFF
ncbi:MAG: hypothetical protein ACE1Z2_08460, partial [Acidobacteriota bacterium]